MIYFVQSADTRLIKIGTTRCVATRLYSLKAEYPGQLAVLGIHDGDFAVEKDLHKQFADIRVNSEWFRPAEELLAYIWENATQWDPKDGPTRIVISVPREWRAKAQYNADVRDERLQDYIASIVLRQVKRDFAAEFIKFERERQPESECDEELADETSTNAPTA